MINSVCIKGGVRLVGEVTPIPNKNSILPALIASLLTNKDMIYHSVPNSTDVNLILKILEKLGAVIDLVDYNNLKINCSNVKSFKIDPELGSRFRASILFVGPLLARFGKAQVPLPGGCFLGRRSIASHIDVFTKFGANFSISKGFAFFTLPKILKSSISSFVWQIEASPTGTENFLMLAASISKTVTLYNAACEPHVTDLLCLLEKMGVTVKGFGTNIVTIKGGNLLGAEFTPRPDHIDIADYMVAAAITDGRITIKGANLPDVVGGIVSNLLEFGVGVESVGKDIIVFRERELEIKWKISSMPLALDAMPKFVPRPWPGFPVDALPSVVVLATRSKGKTLLMNWMYETGFTFVSSLIKLGASIIEPDPQKIIVEGPCTYKSDEVTAPGVIQGAKALFLASLCDPVKITINGVDILKRRYPDIFEVYKKLGARIKILP